ncbi:hypothetical protein DFP91_5805, partial [Pseudorhodoplanes sinuspersici]
MRFLLISAGYIGFDFSEELTCDIFGHRASRCD